MKSHHLAAFLTVATLWSLTACSVGPDFHPPSAPQGAGFTPEAPVNPVSTAKTIAGSPQHFDAGRDLPGEWWTLFRSQPLDDLIKRALAANPDLDAAQAALRQARENLYAGQGALFPTASAQFEPSRQKISGAAFGAPNQSPTLSLITAQLNISYAPDVWGGTRRQIESLAAQVDFQRFELEASYLTLTSNIVVAAINEASLRAQIATTQDIIRADRDQLDVVRQQFTIGGASRADVLQQEAALAQSRATLPPLQKQLAQQRDQLVALLGGFPNESLAARFELQTLHLPEQLPVSLPSQLVQQRPDIRAAEAQFHAASASLGVAIANQLPQFAITGALGSESLGFSNLFSAGTGIWTIAGSITQTLFDAGMLQHKKRAAAAALEQAAAQYRSTVVQAFQNVADTLRALQYDADLVHEQAAAERSASDSYALARTQFRNGAISYLTLLNADRTWQQARLNLVQAQALRFSDTAALFQALGGGWWHRADVTPATQGPQRLVVPVLSAFQP